MLRRSIPALAFLLGCGVTIEPGHRGLVFDPHDGLQRTVLAPGWHRLATHQRVDDFPVTYMTRREPMKVATAEGLPLDVVVSVIYRPIIAELYELDSELGAHYYDDVVQPEFRSAARAVLARTSTFDPLRHGEKVEDAVEAALRQRLRGKHVEVYGVVLESVRLPPELAAAIAAREHR